MGKRDSASKKSRHARDIVRTLHSIGRMRGVPLFAEDNLWLLSKVPGQPRDPAALAGALFAEQFADRQALLRLLGAREVLPLHPGRLGGWSRDITELENRRDIPDLLREGVRPLRSYRGEDVAARIVRARQGLDRLRLLLPAAQAAGACRLDAGDEEPGPEILVRSLPLRLYALGSGPIDPVEWLQTRDVPAEPALLRLALETTDRGLANLAALLLGIRRRRSPLGSRGWSEGGLPPHLGPAFQAGLSGSVFSPCLWALAVGQGLAETPPLDGIPPASLAALARVAERVALLYGVPAALSTLDNLARPLGAGDRRTARLRQRLKRLEELVRAHEQGRRVTAANPDESELLDRLERASAGGQVSDRELIRLFLFWLTDFVDGRRPLGLRRLGRIAHGEGGGLTAAVRALGRAWLQTVRHQEQQPFDTSAAAQQDRLALSLVQPQAELRIPEDADRDKLQRLAEIIAGVDIGRLREVWPVLVEADHSQPWKCWPRLVQSDMPAALLARAVKADLHHAADQFASQPQQFARYLDCVGALQQTMAGRLDWTSDWFINLFRAGKAWAPAVVLVLLGQARAANTPREDPAALFALGRDLTNQAMLADHGKVLARALDEWNSPTVQAPPPRLAELAQVLGVTPALLEEYLHHRRLAGHGETFAQALLEPLTGAERDAREAAFLSGRLAEPGISAGERAHLASRLARLTDPQVLEAVRRKSAQRARHRLERALELLKHESLECVLDGVYRRYLERHLGQRLPPGPLPTGLREALHLFYAPHISQELLTSFLTDVLHGRPRTERPPNRQWLDRAAVAGINTRAWLAGVSTTVTVEGTPITFATEANPLLVLKMGSYFETCLTLEGGMNAASTLVNALDVNKQVIYGRKKDGTVVSRKLIGATLTGELAGYHTYANANVDAIRTHLDQALAVFAGNCRLRLSDQATPEVLHEGFWYDDGNEPWDTAGRPEALALPPAGLPQDAAAAAEWALHQAAARGDPEGLRTVALHGRSPWREAALFRLLRDHIPAVTNYPWLSHRGEDRWTVARALTYQAGFSWLLPQVGVLRGEGSFSIFQGLLECLPCDRDKIEAAIHKVKEVAQGSLSGAGSGNIYFLRPPHYLAMATLDQLIELYRAMWRLSAPTSETDEDNRQAWVEHAAELAQIAWLRDGDPAPLLRGLAEGGPDLTAIIVELARREIIPGVEIGLRRLLKASGPEREEAIALALGTQGDRRDGPELLARLRQRPHSLALAAAVARCGDADAAGEARSLWRPPLDLDGGLQDPVWVSRAREVGSPRLARRLARQIRRSVEGLYREGDLEGVLSEFAIRDRLRQLALLGLPGPEGDPAAVMGPFLKWEPFVKACGWWPDVVPAARELLLQVQQIDGMAGLLGRSESDSLRALAWWRDFRQGHPLRHEGFERGMRWLAARGTPAERAQAAELWFRYSEDGARQHLAGLFLGLFREGRAGVPEQLRHDLADVCFTPPLLQHETTTVLERFLAWREGDPMKRQAGVNCQDTGLFPTLNWSAAKLVFLLALEGAASRRALVESCFRTWARHDPVTLLAYLEFAPVWLPPETAEPFVGRLLKEVDPARVGADTLLSYLNSPESARSYLFQRLLIQILLPRLPVGEQEKVREDLKAGTPHERARWVLELLLRDQESGIRGQELE
jgi:hypothetical protein